MSNSASKPINPVKDFSVLSGVGRLVSALGWIVVFFSFFGFFAYASSQKNLSQVEFIPFVISVFFAIIGLLVVAMGQMVTCLVAIERNTKDTANCVREFYGSQVASNELNKDGAVKDIAS